MHQSVQIPNLPCRGDPKLMCQLRELFQRHCPCTHCGGAGRLWIAMADLGSCGVPCGCSDPHARQRDPAEWIAWGITGLASTAFYVIALVA